MEIPLNPPLKKGEAHRCLNLLKPKSCVEFAEDLPAAGRCKGGRGADVLRILQVLADTADSVKPALPEGKLFSDTITAAFMAASNRCVLCKYDISIIR